MASLDLTRLMTNCRVHLPGALDTALQLELFNVLDDFFQSTNIWQEDITFQVTAGDTAYLGAPAAISGAINDCVAPLGISFNKLPIRISAIGDAIADAQQGKPQEQAT